MHVSGAPLYYIEPTMSHADKIKMQFNRSEKFRRYTANYKTNMIIITIIPYNLGKTRQKYLGNKFI
ncbi:hypothetical protein SINU_12845 [Sporolactobacillus inulinus CASD]|uniref:Uncharacterized protein n=1 Tax=Sporolactobacillus inulinus CASD TaxID=1069536 RepID=A0A0U1QL55_9BACL|nr:hypothetical protein SINU_12845 [Sporolactobacillus inulinus CASD]GEB78467.1 hypothetical protein SIN01_28120 [Sporolactobacillus inulinus]